MNDLFNNDSLKYNKAQKYLSFDFETSCLNTLTNNLPWQLGFITATRDEVLEKYNIYIKWPNLKMSVDAARITRYDENLVNRQGVDPREALELFEKYLYDPEYKISGFNIIQFDYYVHNIMRKVLGFKSDYSYVSRSLDVRALYMAYKLGIQFKETDNPYLLQKKVIAFHERGFKNNLTLACKEFGVEVDETKTHDGIYDTIICHKLLIELLKKIDIK